jgi:glycerol-3-phosphate acyltransferase PlsY
MTPPRPTPAFRIIAPMDPASLSSVATASGDPTPFLWAALPIGAYVIGSFPTAHLLARSRGVDLGQVGSKSYGATNLGRTLGRTWGIACFLIDALKGAIPVLVSGWLLGSLGATSGVSSETIWCWLAVAAAAIIGHTLSPWIKFKGGKGVATGFGALVAMAPVMTLPTAQALAVWLALVVAFRMVSFASIAAAWTIPVAIAVRALFDGGIDGVRAVGPYVLASLAIAVFITIKHRANLARIRAGTESKVKLGKSDASAPAAGERTS